MIEVPTQPQPEGFNITEQIKPTVDIYRQLGPLAEPAVIAEDNPYLYEELGAKMLAPPETGEDSLRWLLSNANSRELGAHLTQDERIIAANMFLDGLYLHGETNTTSPNQLQLSFVVVRNLINSLASDANASTSTKAQTALLEHDLYSWYARNNEALANTETPEQIAKTAIDKLYALRHASPRLASSELFEAAVALSLEYQLWQQETGDSDHYARMATFREDKPMLGTSSRGGSVAHDIVLQMGDQRYRLQAKRGAATEEALILPNGKPKYDLSKITLVTSSMEAAELDQMLIDIKGAYAGNETSVANLEQTLFSLKLLDKVNPRAHAKRLAKSLVASSVTTTAGN